MGGGGAVHTGSWVYVLKHSEERMQPATWEVPRADPILRALCRGQKAGTGSSFCPKWWLMLGTQQKGQTCVYCCGVLLTLVHGRADGAQAAAPCWDGCLVAAAAWEHGCAQGLFPALSWHTGPSWQSRKPSLCSLPRWLGPEFVFGNCSERHCTFHVLCPAERLGSQMMEDYGKVYPAQLHWRTSPCFILMLVWRGCADFQEGKSNMRFLQEVWELKIAMSCINLKVLWT